MATVKLKLRQSEEGFLVILTLTNREFEAEGFLALLPPKLELSFNNWQSAYRQIEAVPQSAESPDGLAIAVHPSLSIEGLTLDQLKEIYTGQITNWNQVGGPNLKITPYSRSLDDSGTTEFFKENILGNKNLGANVVLIPTTTQALNRVGKLPNEGGIYYASAPEVINQCLVKTLRISRHVGSSFIGLYQDSAKSGEECSGQYKQLNLEALQNGEYPITRRLFVIIKQNGQVDEDAGEAYARLLM